MQLTEQIGMVLLVFALLGGLLWFSKQRGLASFSFGSKRGRGPNGRRLEVLERLPLTGQHVLHLVRVANRTVLIATAPSSCTVLDTPVNLDSSLSSQPHDLFKSSQ